MKDVPGPSDPLVERAENLGIPSNYLTGLRGSGEFDLEESEVLEALEDITPEQIQSSRDKLKKLAHNNKNWSPEQADRLAEKALRANIRARVLEDKYPDPGQALSDLFTEIEGHDPEGWRELIEKT